MRWPFGVAIFGLRGRPCENRCVCALISPGITYFPVPSRTWYSFGTGTSALGATVSMRPCAPTRIIISGSRVPRSSPVTRLMCTNANGSMVLDILDVIVGSLFSVGISAGFQLKPSGANDATGTREDTNADAHVPAARLGHISAPNAVNTTRYAMTTQHAMTSPRRMRMTRQCVRAIPSS